MLAEMRHSCGADDVASLRPFRFRIFSVRATTGRSLMNKRSWWMDRIQAVDSLEIIENCCCSSGMPVAVKAITLARRSTFILVFIRRDPALLDLTWTGQLFENYSNLSAFSASLFRNERYFTREPHHRPPPSQSF